MDFKERVAIFGCWKPQCKEVVNSLMQIQVHAIDGAKGYSPSFHDKTWRIYAYVRGSKKGSNGVTTCKLWLKDHSHHEVYVYVEGSWVKMTQDTVF